MIKTDTWLPVFSGFYGTIWEADDDLMVEDLKEIGREKGYTDEKIEKIIDEIWHSKHYSEVYKEYEIEVTTMITEQIEKFLKEINMVKKIVYQTIVSPKYYNFQNDGVNIQVHFSKENVKNIKEYIKNNYEQWTEYLKSRYTSRDGFISHHDNYPGSDEWQIDNAIEHGHRAGSLLNFICLNENQDDLRNHSDFEYEIYEYVNGNTCFYLDLETLENEINSKV